MDDMHNEYKVNIDKVDKIECTDFNTFNVHTTKGSIYKGIKVYTKKSDPNNLYEEEREFLFRFGIDRYKGGVHVGVTTWKSF